MSHTKGPWFADLKSRPVSVYYDFKGLAAPIADWVGGDGIDEELANAKLIAAAPELLAALIAVVEDRFFDEMTNTTCTLVTEAINKATK